MARTVVSSVLLACSAAVVTAAEPDHSSLALENEALRIEIQRLPAPHVSGLLHKESGTAVVSTPKDRDLLALVLGNSDGNSKTITGAMARRSRAALKTVEGGKEIAIEWSDFPDLDLSVRASVRCLSSERNLLWSIAVENHAPMSLKRVRFPRIPAVEQIGRADDDFLVLPALPGTLIENPRNNWPAGYTVTLDYPGSLSAQFLSYQDRTAGVYLAGMDPAAHSMALAVARRSDSFMLWHEYVLAAKPEQPWISPYPVALCVTQGTWCDSADLYKEWACRQPWCAKTLVERDDIPAWWKEGPDVHVCEVRTYDNNRICNGSYYPKLLEHLQTFRERIEGPVVPMLAGWENHRRWTAGDYFPIFDSPRADKTIAQLREAGFRPFFFLSGLFYTFENAGRDKARIPDADKYAAHFVVDSKSGKPSVYTLNESRAPHVWKRHSYQFCVGDPASTRFFCEIVDRAHALGIDVLQMDQTVRGGGAACYSEQHDHAPGPGHYQTQGFHALLAAMRARGKQNSADFVLFHEEPHEQLIGLLDGFHVREYYAKRWYRGYPGAVGIPLFCYLYHEYAIGYGGDSAPLNRHNSRNFVRAHALNLVTGRTPGGSVWSSQRSMFDAHPDQIAMIRNHCRLLKTPAREFLIPGKMLHPYELEVPKLTFHFGTAKQARSPSKDTHDPAVLTSSWQSPRGQIGHLFVNIAEEPQPLTVALDTRNAPGWSSCDVSLWSSQSEASFQPLWRRTHLPKSFSRRLQPLEVLFVTIAPN